MLGQAAITGSEKHLSCYQDDLVILLERCAMPLLDLTRTHFVAHQQVAQGQCDL